MNPFPTFNAQLRAAAFGVVLIVWLVAIIYVRATYGA